MNHKKMQDTEFQDLKEISWRRALNAPEAARLRQWLAAHPESRATWEQEAAFDRLMHRLPAAPVSSNFTARVMQAVQQGQTARATGRAGWLPATWLPRFALGVAMICVGFLSFHGFQAAQRAHTARELASVSRLAALPPMAWLKDFDTIERLNKVQVADDDLLAALQ